MTKIDDVLLLVEEKKKLEKKVKKLQDSIRNLTSSITQECTCPEEYSKKKQSWSYGGYDYQGEDRTWDECSICGKSKNLKIRYTGFG